MGVFGSGDENPGNLFFALLKEQRFAEAELLLKDLSGSEKPDVLFNAALVWLRAGEPEKALPTLEKARTGIRNPGASFTVRTDTYRKLRAADIEQQNYLRPMDSEYIEAFPHSARENILLTMIDAYAQCGREDRAAALSLSLTGDEFAAVKAKYAQK
jgi:hypothetical protein